MRLRKVADTADGRLIGAVAYGLAASTPIAGITPAADLDRLLTADPDDPAPAGRLRARVRPGAAAVRAGAGALTRTPPRPVADPPGAG